MVMPGETLAEALDGVSVIEAETVWALIVFGLPVLGKVPTAWLGRPLPVRLRRELEQVQFQVAVSVPADE